MVPRIKESRGDLGPPPCGVLWEEEAHGGPIFPRIQQMKDGLNSEESSWQGNRATAADDKK